MQTDMHYYGTYCLARSAGLIDVVAQEIATAAEYVDDSADLALVLSDKVMLKARATAHHPIDGDNLDELSQREIWVPFHFLPGNEGATMDEKLVCRKNSDIAREMVDHHLSLCTEDYGPELMGITAHVYADTFSHYGFSGISSDLNKVDGKTIKLEVKDQGVLNYIQNKYDEFKEKYATNGITNLVKLGHGSVGTYPDRPYLAWEFIYEENGHSSGVRNNQATFMEACESLHGIFLSYAEKMPDLTEQGGRRDFEQIRDEVARVLMLEGDMDNRIAAWQASAKSGALFNNRNHEPIPAYNPDYFSIDEERITGFNAQTVHSTTFFSYLNAAQIHRDYVLSELLPKHGLPVIYRL